MEQPIDDTTDRRMLLRYTGRCRLCGTTLPAGTDAIYERGRRTVRCGECAPANTTSPAGVRPVEKPTPPQLEDADLLRLRAPASSVIAELLRVQASAPAWNGNATVLRPQPLERRKPPLVSGGPWRVGGRQVHGSAWPRVVHDPRGTRWHRWERRGPHRHRTRGRLHDQLEVPKAATCGSPPADCS